MKEPKRAVQGSDNIHISALANPSLSSFLVADSWKSPSPPPRLPRIRASPPRRRRLLALPPPRCCLLVITRHLVVVLAGRRLAVSPSSRPRRHCSLLLHLRSSPSSVLSGSSPLHLCSSARYLCLHQFAFFQCLTASVLCLTASVLPFW
ncbi:hypothetical protein PIB30_069387 [Stylosanthes scabra]|uniref:Uncharacterized protein n=1 Tax=Stylosanthes scabra TaxID=79078 RepID=A0ABU6YQ14_9FABA|nr:hypothetical protein [Stylosanthes scabra]